LHIPESALWAAFILGVLVLPLRSRSLLVSFPLERLGIISYSFYLWHLPVIVGVASLLGIDPSHPGTTPANVLVPAIALAFAVSWAVSELTYRWIERPLLLRKQHLAR
jgi:peptidoglycan/LPS O-acetylase OafA/YrhL